MWACCPWLYVDASSQHADLLEGLWSCLVDQSSFTIHGDYSWKVKRTIHQLDRVYNYCITHKKPLFLSSHPARAQKLHSTGFALTFPVSRRTNHDHDHWKNPEPRPTSIPRVMRRAVVVDATYSGRVRAIVPCTMQSRARPDLWGRRGQGRSQRRSQTVRRT